MTAGDGAIWYESLFESVGIGPDETHCGKCSTAYGGRLSDQVVYEDHGLHRSARWVTISHPITAIPPVPMVDHFER